MESINNSRVEFLLNPDSTYRIFLYNYFFDRFEGEKRPVIKKGTLTKSEFDKFKKTIFNSHLDKMKDTYGFEDFDGEETIVSTIELIRNNKTKYIVINTGTKINFGQDFLDLIQYTNDFISSKIGERFNKAIPTKNRL